MHALPKDIAKYEGKYGDGYAPVRLARIGPTLPPMAKNKLQTQMTPPKSRDGYPLRRGNGVLPGPPETAIGNSTT